MSVAYRQCLLVQPRDWAVVHYTTWLPEVYAVPGEVIRLRREDGSWGDGWRVDSVGPWTLPEAVLRKAERAHLKHRKASDIGRSERRAAGDGREAGGSWCNGGTPAF